MRLRVVCGLDVTLAIFVTGGFTSVDFPGSARREIAKKPNENTFFHRFSDFH